MTDGEPRQRFLFSITNQETATGDTMTSTFTATDAANLNTVLHGDCVQLMRPMPSASIDFIITDPPFITRYADHSGRSVANDDNRNG